MAKRRGNNEGSIYLRKKCPSCKKVSCAPGNKKPWNCEKCGKDLSRIEGRWAAVATIGIKPQTGKPNRKTFYGKTRREAVEKMQGVLSEVRSGTYVEPTNITLEQWLNSWLDGRKGHVAYSTWRNYRNMIKNHLIPEVGKVKMVNLKTRDIQALLNRKMEEGGRKDRKKGSLSSRTVKYIYQTLHGALKQAIKERVIVFNPCESVELPKQHKEEMKPLNWQEVQRFLQEAEGNRYYAAYILELSTGLRKGELLGLKWEDLDFERGTLLVKRQLLRVGKEEGGLVLSEPKTKRSSRKLTLDQSVLNTLKEHRKKQAQEKLLLGECYQDQGLIFATEEGKPVEPRNFTRKFKRILKSAGLPDIRFHDMRHTFATLALEAGIPAKVVQEYLGHSTITMTLDTYSHLTQDMQTESAKIIAGFLENGKKNRPLAGQE